MMEAINNQKGLTPIMGVLSLLLVIGSLVTTIALTNQAQDIRSKAAPMSVTPSVVGPFLDCGGGYTAHNCPQATASGTLPRQ